MLDPTEVLSELVAIPSVNAMGRPSAQGEAAESQLTDHLERMFRRLGIPSVRQSAEPGRDNIIARIDAANPAHDRGPLVFFEAHQDTVPVAGMTIPPWVPQIRGRRLYGRGSCDVKGGMAAMLSAVARLKLERIPNMPPVVLACTVDEEYGFGGARAVADFWRQGSSSILPRRPDCAVVAEPTALEVVVAHKGKSIFHAVVRGKPAHSSLAPRAVNAIDYAADLIVKVRDMERRFEKEGPFDLPCYRLALK